MDYFNYRQNELYAEDLPVALLAKQYGTPLYVYSRKTLERHWHAFNNALGEHPHKICYSVKANSNIAVLNLLARMGSGFDIVSVGELERVLAAGGDPKKIVFSGVGKQAHEMERALSVEIYCFNVESQAELALLNEIAKAQHKIAPVAFRINPNVDAKTHPYISTGLKENKFGIDSDQSFSLFKEAKQLSNIDIIGIDCHIGSQLTELSPFLESLDEILKLVDKLASEGIAIKHLDLGGGLGVRYKDETPPEPAIQASALLHRLEPRPLEIILEPGRAIAANAGLLVTKVQYLKHTSHKHFAIVDCAMNDLIRPALYSAWQNIIPVQPHQNAQALTYDIVGPICETADFLGKDRELSLKPDDLLAIRSAGAYGFVMSSNYNTRPRAAEVMVDGNQSFLIRERESTLDLFAKEALLP